MLSDRSLLLRRLSTVILSAWLAVAVHFPAQSQPDGLGLSLQAQQLYQTGELASAAVAWQKAAKAFESQGDRLGKTKSLINQAQVLQDLGLYPRACTTLLQAFNLEDIQCNTAQVEQLIQLVQIKQPTKITLVEGIGLRSLGIILQKKGMLTQAQKIMEFSLIGTSNTSESGATLLALGNIHQALGNQIRDRWDYEYITEIIDRQDPNNALKPYLTALKTYSQVARDPHTQLLTQTQTQLNHLSLLIELEAWWQQQTQRRIQSWQRLNQGTSVEVAEKFSAVLSAELKDKTSKLITEIGANLPQLPATHQGIYAQINYAQSLTRLQQTTTVESILQKALQQAQLIKDRRGESYALGYLGQNYGRQGKLTQGIALTNQALAVAEAQNVNHDAREVSYLWQSQLGLLLEQSGRREEAIASYTSAFNTLQSLRTDLNTNNQIVQFNFRQEVKPVYLRLANLLLSDHQQASLNKSVTASNTTNTADQNNLELARQVIESLQLAELDNFFQDPCSPTADLAITIDDLDPQAAVIYPIVLSDRLEVILSMAGQPLKLFTTNVSGKEVDLTLDALYDSLYNQSINNSAVNIFSTTPLNPREVTENTQALLPNLQEIYRWLIKPLESELNSNQIETLVFILSGKLQNVPMAALYDGKQYLLEKHSVVLAPSLQLLNTQSKPRNKLKVLAAGLSQQVEIQGEIFPALNNVPEELKQIETIFPRSRQLLDREFTAEKIREQLKADFPIIHLATHGVFSSDPQQTFLVTGDRNVIDLDAFSTLLNSSNTKPELIVLSACDTATGDERAVLGLAGVAVRSGSSTIASLWSVEDGSTSKLMSQFYRQLLNPATKKVDALQQAQLSLIESLRANPPLSELKQLPPHPYYWAAYVLVGNWQ
ncbi:MAG: CHAT domain-containing protein [Pleurocapsa sp. SU_5_0]|nr:CHAT domain-containing protein [Pleurocapsa sp. SU_5_0]NJR46565.1 CHAT domain-containing protein [Hyellaceae cyanobacterium CSU_1_1]